MPTARYALAVDQMNDKVYAMGGSDARTSPDLASNELYFPLGFGSVEQNLPLALIIATVIVIIVIIAIVAVVAVILRKRRRL